MRTACRVSIVISCVALALVIICGPAVTTAANDRGQGVTSVQLPEELRALTVQKQFIRGQGVPVGKVRKIRGHLIIRHGNSSEAYFAARGDNLYAHDELFTLGKSRVRIRFTTADIVNMGADSRIRVDELVDDRRNRRKKTRMSMLRGKAMFYVMRLLKYNQVDTSVRTPTAVCGVRGTKFGIIVRKKTDLWSSMPLYLADASGTPPPNYLLADNGGGEDIETVMIMVEGVGYMTAGGTTTGLGTGQSGTAGPTGPPSAGPTPPGRDQNLNNETNPDGSGSDGGGSDVGDTGDDPNATGELENSGTDTTSSVTQQGLAPAGPTHRIGYFAAILTGYGSAWADNIFISNEQQDHEGPNILGTAVSGGGDITLDGTTGDDPTVTSAEADFKVPLNVGPEHQVESSLMGINQYLEWGYWKMPVLMASSGDYPYSYAIDNPGVYVHGDPTPVENLHGITGHYEGSSWGTVWTRGGGAQVTGTLSADVDLGSTVLQNLNIYASDGGSNSVHIQQSYCTVGFSPTADLDLSLNQVSIKINGTPLDMYDYGRVKVGLFGPNGEAIGGTAAASNYNGDLSAVVGFEGTKTSNVPEPMICD